MGISKKKSYRELKADPVIGVPVLAWLLDRKLVYISIAAVGCLAAGAFVYQGWKSYQEIIAPPEDNSPYLAVDPAQSAGSIWAAGFIENPRGIEGWEVRDGTQPSHGFLQDATGNTAGEVPITLLATRLASAGPERSLAQIYGAGQARRQYDHYVAKLSERGPLESGEVSPSGIQGAKFEGGFILLAGDAIVGAQTASNANRDRLFEEYLRDLESSLRDSGCVDISGTDGSKRSLYFDPNSFEGLQETVEVNPEVNTDYLPTLQALQSLSIANPYAEIPEGPLPASLPALPSEVAKPTIANSPELVDGFTATASYRIQDPIGPGCGWDWSAQNPLEFDESDLERTKEDTLTRVQNDVNGRAQSYVDTRVSWARNAALLTPRLDSWNGYVNAVNGVHDRWAKLESDRSALRPAWDTYLADHRFWSSFDARKAEAEASYSRELTQCRDARSAYDQWYREWGPEALQAKQDEWRRNQQNQRPQPAPSPGATPAPTPTPTTPSVPMPTAPPAPENCRFDPERPAILDEQKPAEPQPPAVPEDVTIPASWPRP